MNNVTLKLAAASAAVFISLTSASALDAGRDKLLWHNKSTGEVSAWQMTASGQISGKQALAWNCNAACASDWSSAGTGDFNSDGINDVLWHNKSTGELSAWILTASGGVSEKLALSWKCDAACSRDWQLAGTGDFNGDSLTDVLWHNRTSGELSAWLIDGYAHVGSKQALTWKCGAAPACANDWTIAGTNDFNSDGVTDVLWQNASTGELSAWLVKSSGEVTGTQALSWKCDASSGCSSTWRVAGTGDFNGDGAVDVLWHDKTSGELSAWLVKRSGEVSSKQPLSWKCDVSSGCDGSWQVIGTM